MHTVAVLALPGTIVFDLATPLEIFGRVRLPDGRPGYRTLVCAETPSVRCGAVDLQVREPLERLREADTIIVPGTTDPAAPTPERVLDALRDAHDAGTTVASICVGAFTLAASGLLDGRRATTHWAAADLFRGLFPHVDLRPEVLYIDDGSIVTSGGAAAGLDLCLHLVERDYGAAMAAAASRLAVMPLHRDGGQAQFIERPAVAAGTDLQQLTVWMIENAARPLTLEEVADRGGMSKRTLDRRFREATRQSPMQWLAATRIRLARELLETTDLGVETIGRRVGYPSAAHFRQQFRRYVELAPAQYRSRFRSPAAAVVS